MEDLFLLAMSMICDKHRPNSSNIKLSVRSSDILVLSHSSACANKHWQVASTTSEVTGTKEWL
jgi:hypothetical protein